MARINNPYIFNTQLNPLDVYQALLERIDKTEALLQIGVLDNLIETVGNDTANFLWIISDLVGEIKELSERLPAPLDD